MAALPATAGGVPVDAQGINMNSAHIVGLTIASLACVTDLRTRRIPNVLTFGAALAGLLYQFVSGGIDGLGHAALGWLVGAVIFILPFALGGLGGGDVKLLAALGAWLGPADVLWLSLYTGVAGGVMALVVSATIRISRHRHPERQVAPQSLARRRDRSRAGDHAREQCRPQAGVRVSDFDGDGGDHMAAMNLYRRLACDKGAELIEFALVFPLLLLVMFGIMDFGLLFQRYETVTNAAREGARIAVLPGYAQADVQARVTQYLAASGLTATPTVAYTAPQALNVGGACVTITGVTVGYPHQYLFIGKIIGLFGGSGFTTKTLTATARMRYEGRGNRVPLAAVHQETV